MKRGLRPQPDTHHEFLEVGVVNVIIKVAVLLLLIVDGCIDELLAAVVDVVDCHPVLGEGSSFVRADAAGAAHRLN